MKKYMAVTFISAWVLQIAASICVRTVGGQNGTLIFQVMLMLCMFMPMLGTLAANGNLKGLGWEPDFKNGKLKWKFAGMVKADYQMIAGKKSICSNEANEYKAALSSNLQLVLRLYNDGVAFRYELSGLNGKLPKELTAYQIPEGTKRWMMQWTDSYEGFFPLNTTGKIKPIGRMAGVVKSPEGYNLR